MHPFTNDTELLSAFLSGDESAFEYIYSEHFRPLCYFAEKFTGPEFAEDIAADSFMKLLQKDLHFDSLRSLKSFLYTATRNSCLDWLRRKKLQGTVFADIQHRAPQTDTSAEHALVQAEMLQAIYRAIANLPERYRSVTQLALLDGLTNEEIAQQTGMADQTVRNHKSEGIKLLRLALSGDDSLSAMLLVTCLLWIAARS